MNRRGADDHEWKKACKKVDERDHNMCRFSRCITTGEYTVFIKSGIVGLQVDHAHVFEVSRYPEEYVNIKNIYLLNRTAHSRIDHFQDPITGYPMDPEHQAYWWWRIIKSSTDAFDESKNYEDMVRALVL